MSRVTTITGEDGNFVVSTADRFDTIRDYKARKIVVATGYYDLANPVDIPGEDLDKVFHYYRDPHPYYDTDVLVIGGKNSAADAALDLWRHGARVTLVHRGPKMSKSVKYWVLPDIENRIKSGQIPAHFRQHRRRNRHRPRHPPHSRRPASSQQRFRLRPHRLPSRLRFPAQHRPRNFPPNNSAPSAIPRAWSPTSPASTSPASSSPAPRTSEIFIENGRFHGKLIADHLGRKPGGENRNFPLDAT